MAVIAGALFFATLACVQMFLFRLARGPVDDDVNEFGRDLGGRRAVLTFFEHEGARHVRASIELPEETPRLDLAQRGARPVLAKWVGALAEHALADEALAARFVCRAPESPRSFEALSRLKPALLAACERFRVCELKLDGRSVVVVVRGVGRADLDALCALLESLARAVLGPGGVLVKGGDALRARCGFCHEDLAAEALTTVACEECSAVVHELCWAEHGHRCPVLGCKGHLPARISSPAGSGP